MRISRPLAFLAAFAAVVASAACGGSDVKDKHYVDGFDGTRFPKGWTIQGPQPVIDTTAGDPAPSMTWLVCNSGGSFAQINQTFYASYSLSASIEFMVYGTSGARTSGIFLDVGGLDYGDENLAEVLPATGTSAGHMDFSIGGLIQITPLPDDGAFHKLEFDIDGYGEAGWLFDSTPIIVNGPIPDTAFGIAIGCGTGPGDDGPVRVLVDNANFEGRVNP